MNIRFGLRHEDFKLVGGSLRTFNGSTVDSFGKTLSVCAAKNDWAAFELVMQCDEDYAINVGKAPWFSQDLERPVIRLAADCPFETSMNIIDMHPDDDRYLKADALLTSPTLEFDGKTIRSVWVEMKIPADAAAGSYTCTLTLWAGNMLADETRIGEAVVNLEVLDYTMPDRSERKCHLDLWQHASNIARKHEVEMWSDAHFAVLEPYIKSLGELGQSAATLIVSEVPWSGQGCTTEQRMRANLFEYSIIGVTKQKDGRFVYDYSKMQRYIDLCVKYGIDREISVFGLANIWGSAEFYAPAKDYPDGIKIRYLDEADGSYKYMRCAAEIDAYIVSLEQYFLATGQMDRVRLAADEPGDVEAYRKSIGHLKSIAPSFKFKAAINHAEFIPEFGNEVYDFVPYINCLSKEFDKMCEYKNTMTGKRFMWYVCCGPAYPNTFLGSHLTESYFIGVLTSYAGLDGFLRWNYTVWNDDPRADIRYGGWRAGDTNFVYPAKNGAPLLTLRYKALKRGLEFYELLERLKATGDTEALDTAYGFVVHEKDIRNYYATPHSLEDICSVNYDDYVALKRFVCEKLAEKKA